MTVGPLTDHIWAHAGAGLTRDVSALATVAGGLVITGDVTGPLADEIHASATPVMLQHRLTVEEKLAPSLFGDEEATADRAWLERQLIRGVPVVTSRATWLPNPGSFQDPAEAIDVVLGRCQAFLAMADSEAPDRQRMALFPVDYRWLRELRWRELLVRAVEQLDGAVGLMVVHRDDPFEDVRVIEGLVALIQCHPSLALLRSDHAALGALAMGAVGGSIGLSTGTRHLVPPGRRGFKDLEDETARLLIRPIWAFWKGSRFDAVPDLPLYICNCAVCGGLSLTRFRDERLAPEADRHTVTCWTSAAAELRSLASSQRQQYWFDLCQRAVRNLDDLFLQDGILEMPSRQLKAWCEFAGIRVV